MPLDRKKLKNLLKSELALFVFDETDSTNHEAKRYEPAFSGAPALFTTTFQTSGRGSKGRDFYCEKDGGLYMTLMLPLKAQTASTLKLTCAAAVAVVKAIESLSPHSPKIKWVNDILVDEKKVCGILCELITDRNNIPKAVIAGIGVNLTVKHFPEELRYTAGALGDIDPEALCAAVVENLLSLYEHPDSRDILDEYVKRSCFVDRTVIYFDGARQKTAKALGITENFELILEENGEKKTVSAGEISIKVKE